MKINTELLRLVKLIDNHVNQFPDNETGDEQLLVTIYDFMGDFKQVMDSTTNAQMDYLAQNYSGFNRFAKWLERMAQGIADGTFEVTKDH